MSILSVVRQSAGMSFIRGCSQNITESAWEKAPRMTYRPNNTASIVTAVGQGVCWYGQVYSFEMEEYA